MPQNRDLSSETDSHNESLDETDESASLADRVPVTRRSCLRSAGVAVASAAAVGGMGSASAKKLVHASEVSGTTYDVPSGVVRILVGQNQYGDYGDLTNALIKAEGSEVEIVSFGSGWEISNVGIDGQTDGDHPVIDVKTDGGSGVVENVYMGDGGGNDQVGLFVKKEHSGTVTLRNIYVAGFEDNGIYASTPGKSSGGGGTTQIENCYGENNGKAHYRLNGDGSYVRDSVAVSDDVSITSRGVWVRRGNAEIENTDISLTDSGSAATSAVWATGGASVDYRNSDYETVYEFGDFEGDVDTSNVGSDPSTSPPSGVPTSAEQAAGGSASSSSSDVDEEDSSEDEEIDESSEDTDAESSTEEEETSEEEESSSEEETPDDGEARGGEGEASSEANEEATGDAEDDDLPNEVTIRSETGENVRYEFAVDGEVETLSSGDTTSDSTAAGRVHSYRDKYEFSGEFTEFRYSGPVEIDVNGQTVYTDSDS